MHSSIDEPHGAPNWGARGGQRLVGAPLRLLQAHASGLAQGPASMPLSQPVMQPQDVPVVYAQSWKWTEQGLPTFGTFIGQALLPD